MDESPGVQGDRVDPAAGARGSWRTSRARPVGAAAARTARGLGRGTKAGARLVGHGGRAGTRRFRVFAQSRGAGETGLARLVELNAVHSAGDTALTLSLVGTIFSIPTGEARGQVAFFLLITMLPFTVVAPLVGPLLDRFRHGRRWAIGTTLATRAFLCWVLADAVATRSAWLFPAALGALVASRAYNIARASAVPRLLPDGFSLVSANSRQSLAAVAGMLLGGALAAAAGRFGPDWSLRVAFVIYVAGTVMAIKLPARVDSSPGEKEPRLRLRRRVGSLPWRVLFTLWCTAGTRLLAGFMTLFLVFLMRDHPITGLPGTLVLGMVVASAALGNAIGSMLGTLVKGMAPETIAATFLLAAAVTALATAAFYSLWTLLACGLMAGLSGQLARLSLDALVQRDVTEAVRTSIFAWSETLLQIAWVVGGGLGIALPLVPGLGFGVIATLLGGTFLMAVRVRVGRHQRRTTGLGLRR